MRPRPAWPRSASGTTGRVADDRAGRRRSQNVLGSTDADSIKKARIEEIIGGEATATGRLGVDQLQTRSASGHGGARHRRRGVDDADAVASSRQIENVIASQATRRRQEVRVEEIIGGEATATGRLGVAQLQDSVAADLAALGIDTESVEALTLDAAGADRERDGLERRGPTPRSAPRSSGSSPNRQSARALGGAAGPQGPARSFGGQAGARRSSGAAAPPSPASRLSAAASSRR